MLGSKNRDFKTGDRLVRRRLAKHNELMMKYVCEGMNKDEASKKAYNDVTRMKFNGRC